MSHGQIRRMTRLEELKKEAMSLTDAERAVLATDLLQTLPVILSGKDEGVAEALRRDAELEADPANGIEWEDLKKQLGR
jgi:putative addiction module component (TIGR02574 family)